MKTLLLILLTFYGVQFTASAQQQAPYIPVGVIDTTQYETVGLKPTVGVKTVTVFEASEASDHYANGVVLAAFKGALYCMCKVLQKMRTATIPVCFIASAPMKATHGASPWC